MVRRTSYKSNFGLILLFMVKVFIVSVIILFFMIYLIKQINSDVEQWLLFYTLLFFAAIASALIAVLYGRIQVDVSDDGIVLRKRGKERASLLFGECQFSSRVYIQRAYLIPISTNRTLCVINASGSQKSYTCHNMTKKSFNSMMDEITYRQRKSLKQMREMPNQTGVIAQQNGEQEAKPLVLPTREAHRDKNNIPMPGDEDFISMTFCVPKDKIIHNEKVRYRSMLLGMLGSCVAMFLAWYFLVYTPASINDSGLVVFTSSLIFGSFFLLPLIILCTLLQRVRRLTPANITICADSFTIDNKEYLRKHIKGFKMIPPINQSLGRHRREFNFLYNGKNHAFLIGSETVKEASFPDYALLYDVLRMFFLNIEYSSRTHLDQAMQSKSNIQTTVNLTRYTHVVKWIPRSDEIVDVARIISRDDPMVVSKVSDCVQNPTVYYKNNKACFLERGIESPHKVSADMLCWLNLADQLERYQYVGIIDWKAEAADIFYHIEIMVSRLKLAADLTDIRYRVIEEMPTECILKEISIELRKQGYYLGYIDTDSDEYALFIITAQDIQKLDVLKNHKGLRICLEFESG